MRGEVLENSPSGADFYRSTACEAPLDVGRTLPSTEPIEPPATIPAAIGIPTDEALQHILEAVSPGSMDVPDAAALRVLERDRQLNL